MMPPRRPAKTIAIAAQFHHVAGIDEAVLVGERAHRRRHSATPCAASGCAASRPRPSSRRRREPLRHKTRESRRGRRLTSNATPASVEAISVADGRPAEKRCASCPGSPGRRSLRTAGHNAARFSGSPATSARGANASACPTDASRHAGQGDRDDRRSARRRSTAPATRRRAPRARKSASRHSGGCRRTCPTRRGPSGCFRRKGRRQAGEAVHDHFRHAGRAGGQQHPFGLQRRRRKLRRPRRSSARRRREPEDRTPSLAGEPAIDHHGIDLGAGDQRREMIGIGIRRQNGEAARDAVKFDQRQRRRELAAGREQHRLARQFAEPAAERRSAGEIGVAGARGAIPEEPLRRRVADMLPQRLRLSARHFHRLSRSRRKSRETARPRTP